MGVDFADLEFEALEEEVLDDRLESVGGFGLDLAFTSVIDLMMGLMELEGAFIMI